jgi:uncharacterized protein YyaL (SSP411 family)
MANRLSGESSPYLLQHAHNPVDWYPWGEEALAAARSANKPILVSIGYAACHWCHVMERESFEDPDVAAIMNQHFINIKVDREERPDIDHIYMDALTSMTGSGGWPLNVFLTPDGKPFYGGTYFPPRPYRNMPAWREVLEGVSKAWTERQEAVLSQADNLTAHLMEANKLGEHAAPGFQFSEHHLEQISRALLKTADMAEGGFGRAPKFPQTFSINYLLRYAARFMDKKSRFVYYNNGEGRRENGEGRMEKGEGGKEKGEGRREVVWTDDATDLAQKALDQALLSLDKMIAGGIYDQLGGGLARYSTDREWLIPHFEKMLYDQALFVSVLAEAWQLTGNPDYADTIRQTVDFLETSLLSPEGSFYSALDADSEGEEGKFYLWEQGEVEEVLGEDASLACEWLGITLEGNWEGINILTKNRRFDELLELGYCNNNPDLLREKLESIRQRLLERRAGRIAPGLDDKQLLSWNALMNTALSKAYAATGEERYRQLAERNLDWMLRTFVGEEYRLRHSYKSGKAQFPGFLDDYAYLVQALIYLQEITGRASLLETAKNLTRSVIRDFSAADSSLFYYTSQLQSDVIVRKREVYDGAQPSGNSVMAFNLRYLGIVFDQADWIGKAEAMVAAMAEAVVNFPGSFGFWAMELMGWVDGLAEIVVVGPEAEDYRKEIMYNFIPYRVFQSATRENKAYPLLRNKLPTPDTLIYLCQSYNCLRPQSAIDRFLDDL